jgi:hypothetical protein
LSHCEDYALWGTWLRFFKPAMVEEVLFEYTVSSTSVSGRHAQQQRAATQAVLQSFLDLGDASQFPASLRRLSQAIGASLFDAGLLAFNLWKHGSPAVVPESALEPLRVLLPDRRLHAKPVQGDTAPANRRQRAERAVRIAVL